MGLTRVPMNDTARLLGLAPSEWRILEHRLAVPDALADVFSEENCELGDRFYAREDVGFVTDALWRGDVKSAMDCSPMIVADVLADSVNGSTWYACAQSANAGGELSNYALEQEYSRGVALAVKVREYCKSIGHEREVEFPTY